jgi:dienelactone hydrolase
MKRTPIFAAAILVTLSLFSGCYAGLATGEASRENPTGTADNEANPLHPADTWGPYVGGARHEVIPAPSGNSFTDVIGYPAIGTGDYGWDLPVDKQDAPYPVITLCPGYGASADDWSDMGMYFGSWGFVCVIIDIGTHYGSAPPVPPGIDPTVAIGANTYALDYVAGRTSSHWLYGMADTNNAGAMGHSVGGRVCIGAASSDPRYKAVSPMCAAAWSATDPSQVHVPIQYQVGEFDSSWRTETVNNLYPKSNAVKSLITVLGMGHVYGSGPSGPWVPISYVETFFDYWLKHNASCEPWVYGDEVKNDLLITFECSTAGMIPEACAALIALPVACVLFSATIKMRRSRKK